MTFTPSDPTMRVTFLAFALLFAGCEVLGGDDEGSAPVATGVVVANGGNFSDQNGFLTVHNPETEETDHLQDLQGFVHGVELADDRLYVIVNTFGPGRVDVLDANELVRIDQYSGLASPRDVVVDDGIVWVAGFTFGEPGEVAPIDQVTGEVGPAIDVGDVPQGVAVADDHLFVANNGSLGSGTTLSVIDPAERALQETIETGCDGPRDLFASDTSTLIVVCTGKTVYTDDFTEIVESTNGQILFLDAASRSVTDRINLPGQAQSTNGSETAVFSDRTSELFVTMSTAGQIAVVDAAARSISQVVDVEPSAGLTGLSGIAYDPARDEIYVGRLPVGAGTAPDFAAAGRVVVIGRDGAVRSSFEVGPSVSDIVLQFTQ